MATPLRDRYLQDSINTASPAKLLLMLYDRLVLDLMQAEEALRTLQQFKQTPEWVADPEQRAHQHEQRVEMRGAAHERLTHAQDIVLELRTTLNVDAWSGGPPWPTSTAGCSTS
jgi:flagellar protein FliS